MMLTSYLITVLQISKNKKNLLLQRLNNQLLIVTADWKIVSGADQPKHNPPFKAIGMQIIKWQLKLEKLLQ